MSIKNNLLLLALLLPSFNALATNPNAGEYEKKETFILQELAKDYKKPACHPDCISIQSIEQKISNQELILSMNFSNAANIPLLSKIPVSSSYSISHVENLKIAKNKDSTFVLLQPGNNKVNVHYVVQDNNNSSFESIFPIIGTGTNVHSNGYNFNIVQTETKVIKENINKEKNATFSNTIDITRYIQIRDKISTSYTLENPYSQSKTIRLKLAEDEILTNGDVNSLSSESNTITAILKGNSSLSFNTESPIKNTYSIKPFPNTHEHWIVQQSPIYELTFTGTPLATSKNGLEFYPYSNESLSLQLKLIEQKSGKNYSISSVDYSINKNQHQLSFIANSSITQTIPVVLDKPYNIKTITINNNGQNRQISPQKEGNTLKVPVGQGTFNISIDYEDISKISNYPVFFETPKISFGQAEVFNTNIHINPNNSWIIWTKQTAFSPILLFWGYLFTIALVSVALAKFKILNLNIWQWSILAVNILVLPGALSFIIYLTLILLHFKKEIMERLKFKVYQNSLFVLSGFSLLFILGGIQQNLTGEPFTNSMITTASHARSIGLSWYFDYSSSTIAQVYFISFPNYIYRGFMFIFALLLALIGLKIIKEVWAALTIDYSIPRPKKPAVIKEDKTSE